MKTDAPSTQPSTSSREQFFELNYPLLREQTPMKWMGRLFLRLTDGGYPRLVDLPTGAGKTDVVVIWVLALSWYGLDTAARKPVPRRLIWVINRRVLVQQVFRLAGKLQGKLSGAGGDRCTLSDVREGLARLSGEPADILRVIQLRGQLVDDREWSVAPSVPQLIIGTVDQIGSRLLFQGYSLGKWSRPLQAALLGVDAWICLDEAHLVPAFVLTLRQTQRMIADEAHRTSNALFAVFERLPFWMTELSATPALPPPSAESAFRLLPDDEGDPRLQDRILAARTRRVSVRWLANTEKSEEVIEKAAAELEGKVEAVAVFVRAPKDANKIAAGLTKRFNKERVLKITGRLRGYERDRLERQKVFERFGPAEEGDQAGGAKETVFLVGTAAAEVGLDADAAAIVCDFASLPTLLQRLGRLDRRGCLSRRFSDGECEAPPTMTIFAKREETRPDIQMRVRKLAQELGAEKDDLPASLLVGTRWKEATAKSKEAEIEVPEAEDKKAKDVDPSEIVRAATRGVLLGGGQDGSDAVKVGAQPPSTWLKHPLSCVTGGPVAVPPLTAAVVEHWSGTTDPRSAFLPVHPFLYGILPDPEGTPLVSVAFRLEMDALAAAPSDEDDEYQGQTAETQVREIFRRFPPQRAEFHLVSLGDAREWFSTPEASGIPVAFFDGEECSVTWDHRDKTSLRPGATLILPTLARASVSKLLESANDPKDERASRDVLEGVSTQHPRYWRRIVQVEPGDYRLKSEDGASRFEAIEAAEKSHAVPHRAAVPEPPHGTTWQVRSWALRIGTDAFRFEYLKPRREVQSQLLAEHLERAEKDAARIARTLAPDNGFLRSLLVEAAKVHDEGKRNWKWQRAMGNPDCTNPVAKPVKRPASTGGFRHEWESLLRMRTCSPDVPESLSESDAQHWFDLWPHLVAAHHGHLRPWLSDNGFAHEVGKQQQSALRLESAERFVRLQRHLGPWRLAYLEGLLKAVDVAASQATELEESDEQ